MADYLIIIISILAVLAALALILFVLAAVSYKFAFGGRADKNPLLKYFTAADFNLSATPITVKSGKTDLNGFIYSSGNAPLNQTENLIIFAHGMGPGQIAYTTEIAYFCNRGATVLAFDSAGCNFSGGKNIKGMYEGAKTVLAAIGYVRSLPEFAKSKLTLIGHSWGGYSVLCAAAKAAQKIGAKQQKINKVIAISAPCTPAKTIKNGAARIIGKPLAVLLRPFWWIINLLKFGACGNASATKSAKKAAESGAEVLLIHGDSDSIVAPENAVYFKVNKKEVKKYLVKGKAHNPYNTTSAETKLRQLNSALMSKKLTPEEKKKFFKEFDFKAATEEDEDVMQIMI